MTGDMTAMSDLVCEGKVRAIGASSWSLTAISGPPQHARTPRAPGRCRTRGRWSCRRRCGRRPGGNEWSARPRTPPSNLAPASCTSPMSAWPWSCRRCRRSSSDPRCFRHRHSRRRQGYGRDGGAVRAQRGVLDANERWESARDDNSGPVSEGSASFEIDLVPLAPSEKWRQ
jgi:hypothetical protein